MDFNGIPIQVSPYALKETEERTFPVSRHRSKRLHKKLCKRHGGEFKKEPAIFLTKQGYLMHPAMYEELKRETERRALKNYSMGYDAARA